MKVRILRLLILFIFLCAIFGGGFYREQRDELKAADSFYQKLADGFDVNILIVGDSISEGAGASDEQHRWASLLQQKLEDTYHVKVMINNVSLGGNTSYAGYVRTRCLMDGDSYDLAIVCFAENDVEEAFDLYYESVLRAIQCKCPNASVMTILESSQREYTMKIQIVQDLSEYYHATVIDTIAAFNNSGVAYEELSDDGIHPSDAGHELYYEEVWKAIESGVQGYQPKEDAVMTPQNEAVTQFDGFEYYDKDDMLAVECNTDAAKTTSSDTNVDNADSIAENNTDAVVENATEQTMGDIPMDASSPSANSLTYKINMSLQSGTLGIDYMYAPEVSGLIDIYVDGELAQTVNTEWNNGIYQRHIWILLQDCNIEDSVEIRFDNAEQLQYFYGIAASMPDDK